MKAGDKVIVTDGSYSKTIKNNKLVDAWANRPEIRGQHWTVVETNCSFPLEQSFYGQPESYRNDTVIQADNGCVVFIHSGFLKPVDPPHVWEHGDVFDEGDGRYPKIYIKVRGKEPQVFHLSGGMFGCNGKGLPALSEAKEYIEWPAVMFLFNIKDKL